MFNQLIEIDKEGNVLLQDNSIALMPALFKVYKHKRMGSTMVRWIVGMDDYKSPYRRLPESEREERLTFQLFGKKSTKLTKDPLVEDARAEYKSLQYDPLIDQYRAMSEQMFLITRVFKSIKPTKENLDELNDMQVKMHKAAKSRDDIKAMIIKDAESETKIQGTGSEDFSIFEQDENLDI